MREEREVKTVGLKKRKDGGRKGIFVRNEMKKKKNLSAVFRASRRLKDL